MGWIIFFAGMIVAVFCSMAWFAYLSDTAGERALLFVGFGFGIFLSVFVTALSASIDDYEDEKSQVSETARPIEIATKQPPSEYTLQTMYSWNYEYRPLETILEGNVGCDKREVRWLSLMGTDGEMLYCFNIDTAEMRKVDLRN